MKYRSGAAVAAAVLGAARACTLPAPGCLACCLAPSGDARWPPLRAGALQGCRAAGGASEVRQQSPRQPPAWSVCIPCMTRLRCDRQIFLHACSAPACSAGRDGAVLPWRATRVCWQPLQAGTAARVPRAQRPRRPPRSPAPCPVQKHGRVQCPAQAAAGAATQRGAGRGGSILWPVCRGGRRYSRWVP